MHRIQLLSRRRKLKDNFLEGEDVEEIEEELKHISKSHKEGKNKKCEAAQGSLDR